MAAINGMDSLQKEIQREIQVAMDPTWKRNAMRELLILTENLIKMRMANTPRDPSNLAGLSKKRIKLGVGRSYAGNPPAIETGNLRRSIRQWTAMVMADAVGYIGSSADYALYLEEGTREMEARPVWFDAIRDMIKEHADRLHLQELDAAYSKAGG